MMPPADVQRSAEPASARAGGPPFARWLVIGALALVPLVQVVVLLPAFWSGAAEARDFTAYVNAAERVRTAEPLYEPVPPGPHVPGVGAPYLYPPFFAAVASLIPLSGVAFVRAALIAGLLCFWVYAACLGRVSAGRVTAYGTLLWGAALTAGVASLGALYVGQVDSLIWALFGLALAYPAVRGFGFAASALIKPFAVWPLGLALWRERRPVAVGACVAIAAALGLSAVALGPGPMVRACVEWLSDVYPSLAQGQFGYGIPSAPAAATADRALAFLGTGNLSLGFLPLQLAHAAGWSFSGPELPAWARAYLTAVGLAAPLATLWITRARSPELRYAAVMGAAVLFGPIFRATYSPILYAVAAAWLGDRRRRRDGSVPGDHGGNGT